jgi:hypothetical protein
MQCITQGSGTCAGQSRARTGGPKRRSVWEGGNTTSSYHRIVHCCLKVGSNSTLVHQDLKLVRPTILDIQILCVKRDASLGLGRVMQDRACNLAAQDSRTSRCDKTNAYLQHLPAQRCAADAYRPTCTADAPARILAYASAPLDTPPQPISVTFPACESQTRWAANGAGQRRTGSLPIPAGHAVRAWGPWPGACLSFCS